MSAVIPSFSLIRGRIVSLRVELVTEETSCAALLASNIPFEKMLLKLLLGSCVFNELAGV